MSQQAQAKAQKKLDERHEKILRDEANKNGNDECFNCTQKGPFSIVLNYGIFVCNDCAGIHRSNPFNHRIKSINASSFKPEEVTAIINAGGNSTIAKEWHGQFINQGRLVPKPPAGNESRIREFMNFTFVQKRFFTPKTSQQPQQHQQAAPQYQNTVQVQSPPVQSIPQPSSQPIPQNNFANFSNNFANFEQQQPQAKAPEKKNVDLFSFEETPVVKPQPKQQPTPQVDLLGISSLSTPTSSPAPAPSSNETNNQFAQNNLFNAPAANSNANANSLFSQPPQQQQNGSGITNDLFSINFNTPPPQQQFSMQQQQQQFPQQSSPFFPQQQQFPQQTFPQQNPSQQSPFFPQQQQQFPQQSFPMQQQQFPQQQQQFPMQQQQQGFPQQQFPMQQQQFPQQQQQGFPQQQFPQQQQQFPMQQQHQGFPQQQNQQNQQGFPQQSPSPSSTPSVEQLNTMQNQFMQQLKTMPPNQAQSLSMQYQQMNQQQRVQFLFQNFGNKNNIENKDKAPPPGKFANSEEFRDLDVLSR